MTDPCVRKVKKCIQFTQNIMNLITIIMVPEGVSERFAMNNELLFTVTVTVMSHKHSLKFALAPKIYDMKNDQLIQTSPTFHNHSGLSLAEMQHSSVSL